jgi:glutamate racemase
MIKIGVFDSGVGGLSVANAIEKALPNDQILFVNDQKNLPYGSKSPDVLYKLVVPILKKLVDDRCQVIVIACNTVSTTLIEQLRKQIAVPLVAMEPMVKPAAEMTRSKVIAVCATPTTLASKRYKYLKETYAKDIKVLEPDCHDWTQMIENNKLDVQKIEHHINEVCDNGADVIVLGCTHYHWIENLIKRIAQNRAEVIQPEQSVIKQLKRVLGQPL